MSARAPACVLLLAVLALAGGARAEVRVEGPGQCVAPAALTDALAEVLGGYEAGAHLQVTAVELAAARGHVLELRVVVAHSGAIILERTFPLAGRDCPSAIELLAVVLDQFLRDLPRERWDVREPAPRTVIREVPVPTPVVTEKRVVVTRDRADLSLLIYASADARVPDPSGDLELGLLLDFGAGAHGLLGVVAGRVGPPHALGEGRYIETVAMLGLGWRYRLGDVSFHLEARTGGLWIGGVGYPRDHDGWVLWLEGQLGALWDLGPVTLGPHLGLAPLFHEVHTDTGRTRQIPWVRAGLVLGFPVLIAKL